MKRWYTQIDDSGVLYVDVKEHIDELNAKIERKEAVRAQMLAARGAPADVNVSPKLANRVVDRMRARLIQGGFGAQRGLLHDLIERVTATEEQAEVEYRMDLGAALVAFGQKKREPPALTEGSSRTLNSLALLPGRCEPIRGRFTVRFPPPRPKRPPAQQVEEKEPSAVRYLALARQMKALMDAEDINQAEIARRYALTRARVCQLTMLLKLPPNVLAGVDVLAGQRLGARYLSERRVRRTRALAPWSAADGR